MRKAFSTIACMKAKVEQLVKVCQSYHIDGIEIRLDDDNSVLGRSNRAELEALHEKFDQAGITVIDLGSSICICKYEEQYTSDIRQILKYAEFLGAKGIRVFLGNFAAKTNVSLQEPDYEGIVRQLKEMCEAAVTYHAEIWVETHNEFVTGKILRQLIADVGYDNLKIIWDIMHPLEDGEGIEETWCYIGDRIAHVHIKDGFDRRDPEWHDWQYTCLGKGAVPIGSVIKLLERAGYQGYYSLEWEAAWRKELACFDNSLNWVLKQYVDFLDACQKNLLTQPMEKWSRTDASVQENMAGFAVSKYGVEAVIDNRVKNACLKKYGTYATVDPDRTYHISVPYQAYEVGSREMVYGMLTLYDADGVMKRRMYLDEEVCSKKGLTFSTVTETRALLELGIKRYGKAVFYQPLLQECEPKPERNVRIASVYVKVKSEMSYEEHLQQIEEAIDRAAIKGVDLIGLAENLNTRVRVVPPQEVFGTMNGVYCSMLRRKAKEHGCYIFGSFHELDDEGVRRNTAVLIGRNGEVTGKYCKSHITICEYEMGIVPGDSYPVFDTDFGRVGLLICWDAYFPGPARAMVQQGAEMLLITTAGNPIHRHIARAKEHGVYVVVSCLDGSEESGIAATKIIDPCGNILAHTREDGEAAKAVIDLSEEKHIYWLAVGDADAIPANIYRHEVRDDMKDMIE